MVGEQTFSGSGTDCVKYVDSEESGTYSGSVKSSSGERGYVRATDEERV